MSNVTQQSISEALDEPTLFRVAYIPYVLAEVVWDFADTVLNICATLKIQETKKLSRAVRELRTEYNRYRSKYIDAAHQALEVEHREVFIDANTPTLNEFCRQMREHITAKYGKVDADYMYMLLGTYEALAVLRALQLYVADCDRTINEAVGYSNRSIMPTHVFRLRTLLEEFAGNCKMPADDPALVRCINSLYSSMAGDIELTGLKSINE